MQAFIQKYWQSPGAHQSPLIVIWIRADCGFVVSFLSTFSNFSIFAAGFSFAFGNFANYCVVLLIAPLIVTAMSYFSREILIHRHCRCSIRSEFQDNLTGVARVVCEPLWAKISYLILGGIQPLWPIFILFIDLSDFRQTSPKHSGIMANESVSENFDIWNICPVASIYATRLKYILATPALDIDI